MPPPTPARLCAMSATVVEVRSGGAMRRGPVEPGESWAGAAHRLGVGLGGDPVPLDLSGEVKVFLIDFTRTVGLRPMTRGDLRDIARWRAAPHVEKWWHSDGSPDLETVTARYGRDIDGATPTTMWAIEVNGRSVGFLQEYRLSDYPEYAQLTPDPDAIGCDFAIGEPAWVGRGLGTRALGAWAAGVRDRFTDAQHCFAAPDHRNGASLRALAKAGFTPGTWFDEPEADGTTTTVVGCTLDLDRVLGPHAPTR